MDVFVDLISVMTYDISLTWTCSDGPESSVLTMSTRQRWTKSKEIHITGFYVKLLYLNSGKKILPIFLLGIRRSKNLAG